MIGQQARQARTAQPALANASVAKRDLGLEMVARALEERTPEILAANARDVVGAVDLPGPMVARLRLDDNKMAGVIAAVRSVAALPDLLGEEMKAWERPNGLRIQRVRVPLGVIGIIYEARPNVTVDAAVLCLKTGNAVLLKGGKETAASNQAIGEAISLGLERAGLPGELVQILPGTREAANSLMQAVGLVDVLIPRGGAGLIQAVVAQSRVPVIETGAGVCHVYVHSLADLEMAQEIALNAKVSSPAVCNSMETLLVDQAVADRFLPVMGDALQAAGVEVRGCEVSRKLLPWVVPAAPEDWATEYNDLIMNLAVVADLDAAMDHIRTHGTKHSEAIITRDRTVAERFMLEIDAAAVYHNASTRFTDGGEFGFGAEIGISTQKLHARGPMGLAELTSYKYLVRGTGQIR